MSYKSLVKVKTHVKREKLDKLIKSHDQNSDVLKKLYFIRHLYDGKNVHEASELLDVSSSTGYRWLDQWNYEGYEGLYPKYKNAGRKSKLSDEQLQELNRLMLKEQPITTQKLHKMILDNFKVKYSLKRVREIAHILGYTYKKGYIIHSKMLADAETRL